MKKILLSLFYLIFVSVSYSQTTEAEEKLKTFAADTTLGWKKGGTVTTNLSQVALSNWSAGGQNSMSVNGLVSLFGHYKKEKMLWEN